MPSLISDLSSYIWLAVIVSAAFATFDTGEVFGYNAMAAAFAAMLCGFSKLGFYLQCAVFFILMAAMSLAAALIQKIMKGKNDK